ncbi:MAG: class III signal peptide-containing protein [Candidatus Woesearchaeota archaeon]
MKRGQAALEYLILVGVLLVLLITIFNYVFFHSSQNIKIEQAEDSVQTLGKTADTIYTLGPGNRDFVYVNMPGSIKETRIEENLIMIRLTLFGGDSDFYVYTNAQVNGTLPTEKGRYKIKLETLDSGVVQIERA